VIAALSRRAVLIGVAVLCVLSMLPAQQPPPSPDIVPAADTSAFRPGNIISDAVFYDSGAMNATQVQAFLNQQGANCQPASGGPACLKNYRMNTETQAADSFCPGRYAGAANETAAAIIAKVAVACGINPRVILVMLQKETSLVTRSAPTAHLYNRAMGFGCADSMNGACSAYYPGLFRQIYFAAKQFKRYAANPGNYGHVPGIVNNVLFHPNTACGSSPVLIENKATAGLYNYTPYQPNGPALAAGYAAAANSCSSYGNRNFWLYFTDWFGSTQTVGRDVDAPRGSFDQVGAGVSTITVRGWTYDPSAPTSSINVHVYVDGRYATAVPANQSRPDVAAVYPGVGRMTGFNGTIAATPGRRTVCVYAVNTGPGYTNPLLGCRAVNVASFPAHVPVGSVDTMSVSALTVTVGGWVVDPDVPPNPVRVHVYVDGRVVGALTADQPRTDVATAYWRAGPNHGFEWSGTLAAGSHELCFYAINQGAGYANPRVGCKTVTVGGPPFGVFEQVTATPGQVQLEGWAIDPDTVDPISVHVYVDGRYATAAVANVTRTDVETVRPGFGADHGFDVTLPVVGGSRQICVYAINTLSGRSNPRLGCRTVDVPATQFLPVGNVDTATPAPGSVTVSGWALDQDVLTEPLRVHLYLDGTWWDATTANLVRYDIAVAFPGAGVYHGWSLTKALPPGPHEICAFAINQAGGVGNPLLACRTVTIP
jgi:hypothetical protein